MHCKRSWSLHSGSCERVNVRVAVRDPQCNPTPRKCHAVVKLFVSVNVDVDDDEGDDDDVDNVATPSHGARKRQTPWNDEHVMTLVDGVGSAKNLNRNCGAGDESLIVGDEISGGFITTIVVDEVRRPKMLSMIAASILL